jgi:pheromone shutdown-related protein TraB
MLTYKNLILIGTSHISKDSVNQIKTSILKEKPKIIALELDKIRFNSLTSKKKKKIKIKNLKTIGFTGFLFNLIGAWVEKRLGKLVGVSPGSEMIAAIKLARKNKIKILLIDQDIRITLKKLTKNISAKEKLNLISDFLISLIFRQRINKIDLRKVPDQKTIKDLKKQFRKRYPKTYKILVTERNNVMAKNLNKIINKYSDKKTIVIIGAGHQEDIFNLLKNEII